MLILERPWTRQPQTIPIVRPELGRSAVFVGSAGQKILNGSEFAVRGSGITFGVGAQGRLAQAATGALGTGLQITSNTSSIFTNLGAATIAILRRHTDTTLRAAAVFGSLADAAGLVVRIQLHGPYSDGSYYWDFANYNAGGRLTITGIGKTTNWEAIVCVAGQGVGREVWKNGVRLGSSASAKDAFASALTTPFYLGGINTGTNISGSGTVVDNEQFALCVMSPYEWPTAKVIDWCRNPWAGTFEPSRIYIPTATAAATVPTLSTSTYVPGSLTSAGWRPQITAS